MKKAFPRVPVLLAAVFCAALITFLATTDAAASNQSDCSTNGGSWNSVDPTVGTCTYPPNSTVATAQCGPNNEYTFIFFAGGGTQDFCTFVAPASTGGSGGSGNGNGCRSEVRGPLEALVILNVCHGKNGAAAFPIGDCELKCTVASALPDGPARKLPKGAVATMYVRTIANGGEPSNDPYIVCFKTADLGLDPPTIYRFVGGSWVVVAIGNPNGSTVCAIGAGAGSYALGEPGKKE